MKLFIQRIWSKRSLPKLILTDIDGVWTDGGMYYSDSDVEFKKFNTFDSAGVLFAHKLKIPVGIITGENSQAVIRRAKKLNIDYTFIGVENKFEKVKELCAQLGIDLKDVAYIGDDLNDLELIRNVGLSACPASAPRYIKKNATWILKKNGGNGAFREFIEMILYFAKIDPVILYYKN